MNFRVRKRAPKTFETIEDIAHQDVLMRRSSELRERRELSKRLGERAMNGEAFGAEGFIAIGFPEISPQSNKYLEMMMAFDSVKSIKKGRYIKIGKRAEIVGVKSDAGDKGLGFDIYPTTDGHIVTASVLCTAALWSPSYTEEIHGSDEEPYPAKFIDSLISDTVKPVNEIFVARSIDELDIDMFNNPTYTDSLTSRIAEHLGLVAEVPTAG